MKNLHLSSKMSVNSIGNIRNKIILKDFLTGYDRFYTAVTSLIFHTSMAPRGKSERPHCGRGKQLRVPPMGIPHISFTTHVFRKHAGWTHTFKFIWYNFLNGSNSKNWRRLQLNLLSLFVFAFSLSDVQGHKPYWEHGCVRMHSDWNSFLLPFCLTPLRKKKFKTLFIHLLTSIELRFAQESLQVNERMTSQHAELSKSKLLARAECDFMINKYSKLLRGLPRHKGSSPNHFKYCLWRGGGLH